jgi:hypothetical protein
VAWQAKLNQDVFRVGDSTQIGFEVVYYDDVDPATILRGPVTFNFSRNRPLSELRGEIIAEGQAARQAIADVAQLRSQVPNGTTIPIP